MIEAKADIRTIPAEVSLAILADWWYSWVSRSITDSMAVFSISEMMTKEKVKTKINHSQAANEK